MSRSQWPNALSVARIALMPVALALALAGWVGWFTACFFVALSTDLFDGFLARRLNASSELGRKLDSIADYVTLFCGLAAVMVLWPDVVRREWIWFVAVMGSFLAAMAISFLVLGRAPCYHTWLSKGTVAGCVAACIPLFAGWTATPAHVVAGFQVFVGVEQVAIALLVPWHVGEMPTLWHAWQARRRRTQARLEFGT